MRQLYLLPTILSIFTCLIAQTQDTAGFTFTIGPNYTVSFVNTSALGGGGDRKAVWYFGDDTYQLTAALANTEHRYSREGEYRVCLKLYQYRENHDSALTADLCKTILLRLATDQSCKAGFEAGSATDTGLTRLFVAQPWHSNDKRPEQICWKFGDNSDTCIQYDPAVPHRYSVSHTYQEHGSYKACVIIKYQGGCTADFCHEVDVEGAATCKAAYRTETSGEQPLLKYFIAQPWHSRQKNLCEFAGSSATGKIPVFNILQRPVGII